MSLQLIVGSQVACLLLIFFFSPPLKSGEERHCQWPLEVQFLLSFVGLKRWLNEAEVFSRKKKKVIVQLLKFFFLISYLSHLGSSPVTNILLRFPVPQFL